MRLSPELEAEADALVIDMCRSGCQWVKIDLELRERRFSRNPNLRTGWPSHARVKRLLAEGLIEQPGGKRQPYFATASGVAEASAWEGRRIERTISASTRDRGIVDLFVSERRAAGRLICEDCGFDPATRAAAAEINPRSLLDVHHHERDLALSERETRLSDLKLMCPNCHRLETMIRRRGEQP